MKIGPVGLKLIEHFEGFVDHIYQNPGDVPTIGYGTTAGAGVVDPLPETCTQQQAEEWLAEYVNRSVIPAIEDAGGRRMPPLNQNQVDALCSLGYNLGAGIFENTHTIGFALRHGADNAAIAADFTLYEAGDGDPHLAGLVTRREVEAALYRRPIGAPNPGGI